VIDRVVAIAALAVVLMGSGCGNPHQSATQLEGLLNASGSTQSLTIDRVTIIAVVAANCPHADQYLGERVPMIRVLADSRHATFVLVDVSNADVIQRAKAPDLISLSHDGTVVLFDRSGVLLRAYALYYQGGLPTTLFLTATGAPVTRMLGLGVESDYVRNLDLAAR
jgi:hypothetical protein